VSIIPTRQQRRAAERAAAKLHYMVAVVPPLPGIPAEQAEATAALFIKCGPFARASDGTLYFLSTSSHKVESEDFTDTDGTLLGACRYFSTLDNAKAWITRDAHERAAMLSAEGQAQ